MSSRLTQVTVVPACTCSSCGPNVKLSMATPASAAWAVVAARRRTAAKAPRISVRNMPDLAFALALQRRIDNGEPLLVLLEGDACYAEHAAQLVVRHLHRAGRGRCSR